MSGPTYARPVPRALRAAVGPLLRHRDLVVAAGFVTAGLVEAVLRHHDAAALAFNLLGAAGLATLVLRRRDPLLAVTLFTAWFVAGSLTQAWLLPGEPGDAATPIFAVLVLTFALGAHGTRRDLLLGAWQPVLLVTVVDLTAPTSESLPGALLFFTLFLVAAPVLAGRLVLARTRLGDRLAEQAEELARRAASEAAEALLMERLRLAQEVHGDLRHGMESLTEQARQVVARPSLDGVTTIELAARALLARTRDVVVALTDTAPPDAPPEPPPAPSQVRRPAPRDQAAQPWTVLGAAALCAGLLLELGTLHPTVPTSVAVLGCVLTALPLAFAWARPLASTAAVWLAVGLLTRLVVPLGDSFSAIYLVFATPFLVAALLPRRRAVAGLAVCVLGELAAFGPDTLLTRVTIGVAAWIAGAVLYERSEMVRTLHVNNLVLTMRREVAARRARQQERVRLARELHDSLGHGLTVVALQAGAARRRWGHDRAGAEQVLQTVLRAAEDGLAELRAGIDGADLPVAPSSLHDLVDSAAATGLDVQADVDDLRGTDPDAALATYRVVQESLTNVLKHAGTSTARVSVRRVGTELRIEVANGPAPDLSPSSGGHGLPGMRARVEELGGRLDWGRQRDGWFAVRAVLPLAVPTAAERVPA
ncbi:MAG: sensor histidine kinase [Motilibacteraceae bacterium]